jgi:hypothetical protein
MTRPSAVAVLRFTAISYFTGNCTGRSLGFSFWLMLIDTDRKAPIAATLTDGEAASLMKSHIAYTGTTLIPRRHPMGSK